MKWRVLHIFIAGLVIREVLAPFTGHPFDLEIFARVGQIASQGKNPYVMLAPLEGISFTPYGELFSVGYPPLWPLICGVMYAAYELLRPIVDSPLVYYALLKQPIIFADLLCAFLLLRLTQGAAGKKATAFWLFNPLVIIFSSMWGIFDSMAISLCLASLLLIVRGKDRWGSAFIGIATSLKLLPSIWIPVNALFSKRRALALAISISVAALASFLPFIIFGWDPTTFLYAISSQAVNDREVPVFGGISIFSTIGLLEYISPGLQATELLMALNYLWIPAFAIYYALLWAGIIDAKTGRESLYMQTDSRSTEGLLNRMVRHFTIAVLIFTLSRPWVNEQYTLYLIALALLNRSIGGSGRGRLFDSLWIMSLIYVVVNNTLLIRFFSPVWGDAFQIDLWINNDPFFGAVRNFLKIGIGSTFYILAARMLYLQFVHSRRNWQGDTECTG